MVTQSEDLMKRLRDLETSQAKLREQLGDVMQEGQGCSTMIPGFFAHGPYRSVLRHLGHALYVRRVATGEIIYWNQSAEHLFGWMDNESLGHRVTDLVMSEESRPCHEMAMERLSCGQVWSGQMPLKKRSGETFTALVTESPLYEDGEFTGIVTVSSDASVFHKMNLDKSSVCCNQAHGQQKESNINFRRLQWRRQQIASSVTTLASKIFLRNSSNYSSMSEDYKERCECMSENENVQLEKTEAPESTRLPTVRKIMEEKLLKYEEALSKFNEKIKIATIFDKLQILRNDYQVHENEGIQTGPENILSCSSVCRCDEEGQSKNTMISEGSDTKFSEFLNGELLSQRNQDTEGRVWSAENSSPLKEIKCGASNDIQHDSLGRSGNKSDWKRIQEASNEDFSYQAKPWNKHASQKKTEYMKSTVSTTSEESTDSSQEGSSMNEEKDANLIPDCDIRWEDLLIGEQIGEGFYAVVYRGIWHGSDVAIKVYLGKDYKEVVLLDYRKEVNIMKRLRHPNVLLFMGAAYSPDRLAIVTELLPRGSLFRTLHRNNQALDIKRRLRMGLDVARGMNYLHRRKPPIIHRDLKSSNLLVDRNWTVKVGDFGLSCLKNSTVLTAKSGKGTPQWMAPEVLRGEFTSEKSDVFSFGVILWELMTESVPWTDLSPFQVVGVVGFMDRRLDIPEGMDERISSIISECWETDPGRRPSFQEILARMTELAAADRLRGNRPPRASVAGLRPLD